MQNPQIHSRWWPILGLLIGLGLALHPLWRQTFQVVPGGLGDTRLVHFSLEHGTRYLLGVEGHRSLWDPPIFYPASGVAAYTDTLFSQVPFYAPFRFLGLSPLEAYQFWLVLIFGLNFSAGWLFFRRSLGLDALPATAGAFLFAFGSARMARIGHPQLLPAFFILLAAAALVGMLREGADRRSRRKWIALFLFATVLQAYTAFYPLFFLAYLLGWMGLVALFNSTIRSRLWGFLRSEASWILGGSVVAALALMPLALQYLHTAETLGSRPWSSHLKYIPRPLGWFLMGPDNWLYGDLQSPDSWLIREGGAAYGRSVQSNGWGLVTTLCVGIGFLGYRRIAWVRCLVMASVLAIFATTLWPGELTVWRLVYEYIPGASAVRAVGRLGLLLLLPASVGLALFWQKRWPRQGGWTGSGPWLLLLGLLVAEQVHDPPTFKTEEARWRVSKVVEQITPDCRAFFVSTLSRRPERTIHEDAMWAALETGVPTINGRYGNFPPGWGMFWVNRRAKELCRRDEIELRLRRWAGQHELPVSEICWIEMGLPRRLAERIPLAPDDFPEASGCEGDQTVGSGTPKR